MTTVQHVGPDEYVEELGGTLREVARDHREFGRAMKTYATREGELMARYPDEWIAIHGERVVAHGKRQEDVLTAIDAAGTPRSMTLVVFIESEPRRLLIPTPFSSADNA